MRLGSVVQAVMEFCYPGVCAICARSAGAGRVCESCEGELAALEEAGACEWCGMPLAASGNPCPYCQGKGLRPFARVVRLGVFEDPLKSLIHKAKYHGDWPIAELLADRLLARESVNGLLTETDVIVPVPLHPVRQIARGYNQAHVIAARLARRCRIKLAHPAVRLRATETQTHLHSHAQRAANLKHAFGLVRPRAIAGRHVVIVDDVMTSGATLQSLARALRPARPASLSAVLVAIADPKGRGFEAI